ncbi:uncharacterized protein LOC119449949 [Dermacentor silvarum]|uniref:uncharacterized protein LOC119449949 n=1 Tax=Dermacentor silvarum TaxID=543639 RepID=UPI00189B3A0B|nr:uncharacterized protein LOC119449949 [Dermacentor silvarum]
MDLPRVLSMSPHKWDLRWLYLIAFASALLIHRSTAYSVKKSCTTPDGTKSEGQVWYDDARCIKMTCMQGFPVTSSCGKPQPRGKNCRPIPGKGRFPECCTKLLCQTGLAPSKMGSLTLQARKLLLESDPIPVRGPSQVPAMKRAAPEAPMPLARSGHSSARSLSPRLIKQVLERGRNSGAESRAAEATNMMETLPTVGLGRSDAEGRSGLPEDI